MPDGRPSVRLLLIRHGQAGGPGLVYGPTVALTARGLEQASHIAAGLATRDVTRLVSSHYARARQTAEVSAQRLGHELDIDDRLGEIEMGDESEVSIAEIIQEQRYLRLWQPHHRHSERGETLAGFQERVSAALSEIVESGLAAADGATETVAIFTHGGTIAAAMRWAYGQMPHDDWLADVEIHNASITEIERWPLGRHPEGAPQHTALHRLNDVRHLPAELVTDF
ncbi:MAG: histidine phosphatase family protein [Chloroflexi bacterium]|nr:histidine phosphatase family protein [Chloroflexota bacterium]